MGQKPEINDRIFSKLGRHSARPKALRLATIFFAIAGTVATGVAAFYTLKSTGKLEDRNSTESILSAKDQDTPIKAVTSLGRLEPDGEVIKLSAPTSFEGARVAQLLVTQGEEVSTNQVVAVLDNRDRLQAAVESAQKQVKIAQVNLEQVRAGAKTGVIGAQGATIKRLQAELKGEKNAQQTTIDLLETQLSQTQKAQNAIIRRLEAELRSAQNDYERDQKLAQDGAISASALNNRKLQWETATEKLSEAEANRAQVESTLEKQIAEARVNIKKTQEVGDEQINEAKANLEQIKEVRPVDIQEADAKVQSAIAAVKQAQVDLELAYVRAPAAGRILKIHTRAGETVDQKEGIAELGQTEQMVVVAEVDESDISKVRLGQRVAITSESKAFDGELRGSVNKIGLKIGRKNIQSTDPAAPVDGRVVEVNIRLNPEYSKRVASLTYSKVFVQIFL